MAKLTARGSRVVARYETPEGHQYAVRSDGAILRKSAIEGSGWVIWRRYKTVERAVAVAEKRVALLHWRSA